MSKYVDGWWVVKLVDHHAHDYSVGFTRDVIPTVADWMINDDMSQQKEGGVVGKGCKVIRPRKFWEMSTDRQKMNLWNMNFVSSSSPSFYYITIIIILQLSEICRNLFMFSLAQGQMRWDELRWKSVNAMELEDGSIWVYVRCSLALNARLVTVPTYTLCLA